MHKTGNTSSSTNKTNMKTQKSGTTSFRSKSTSLVGIATLALGSASAMAGGSYWQPQPTPPCAPEVGTWLIGAAMVALLVLDFARRKVARKAQRPVS